LTLVSKQRPDGTFIADKPEHQVRRWDSWHRYTTLVMFAHAILIAPGPATTAAAAAKPSVKPTST
jgi:hypothetical protein